MESPALRTLSLFSKPGWAGIFLGQSLGCSPKAWVSTHLSRRPLIVDTKLKVGRETVWATGWARTVAFDWPQQRLWSESIKCIPQVHSAFLGLMSVCMFFSKPESLPLSTPGDLLQIQFHFLFENLHDFSRHISCFLLWVTIVCFTNYTIDINTSDYNYLFTFVCSWKIWG